MSATVAQVARRYAPKGAYSWPRALPALNVRCSGEKAVEMAAEKCHWRQRSNFDLVPL